MELASKVQQVPLHPRQPISWASRSSIFLINSSRLFGRVIKRHIMAVSKLRQVFGMIELMQYI